MADQNVNTDDTGDKDKGKDQAQSSVNTDVNSDRMIPKSRFDEINQKKKAAEDELKAVADELTKDVPDDYKDLIPDLPPGELIKWLRKSTSMGIFTKPASNGPDSDRPGGKPPQDLTNTAPHDLRKSGYKT